MTTATKVVLFDLDGTISDSAQGILSSLRRAFADHQVPWVDDQMARSLLGPPFWHSLPPLVGEHKLAAVIASYRGYYDAGRALFDTAIYQGIAELLETLATRDLILAVATSKPEEPAVEIVKHLGLADYFVTVGGDTLDGRRDTKAAVVGEVLHRLEDPDPATVLMLGDRSHDVLGAAAHGVHCAGALWGYGNVAELTNAGALRLLHEPAEFLDVLVP